MTTSTDTGTTTTKADPARQARKALRAMARGAVLRHQHTQRGPDWRLSSGLRLLPESARLVITDRHVIETDGAMIPGCAGQTWRWTEIPKKGNER